MKANFLITGAAAGIGLEYTRQGTTLARFQLSSETVAETERFQGLKDSVMGGSFVYIIGDMS